MLSDNRFTPRCGVWGSHAYCIDTSTGAVKLSHQPLNDGFYPPFGHGIGGGDAYTGVPVGVNH